MGHLGALCHVWTHPQYNKNIKPTNQPHLGPPLHCQSVRRSSMWPIGRGKCQGRRFSPTPLQLRRFFHVLPSSWVGFVQGKGGRFCQPKRPPAADFREGGYFHLLERTLKKNDELINPLYTRCAGMTPSQKERFNQLKWTSTGTFGFLGVVQLCRTTATTCTQHWEKRQQFRTYFLNKDLMTNTRGMYIIHDMIGQRRQNRGSNNSQTILKC